MLDVTARSVAASAGHLRETVFHALYIQTVGLYFLAGRYFYA